MTQATPEHEDHSRALERPEAGSSLMVAALRRLAPLAGLAVVFTLAQVELQAPRQPWFFPYRDDTSYLLDGLSRVDGLREGGLPGFARQWLEYPPHSPFSSTLATASLLLLGSDVRAPYRANALVVFLLLATVDLLACRGASKGGRAVAAVLALTFPLAGAAVAEFRPDIAAGVLSAGAAAGALSGLAPHWRPLLGLATGLAILAKPTLTPLSLGLPMVAVVSVAFDDARRLGRPLVVELRGWCSALLGLAVCAPHLVRTAPHYLAYVAMAISGEESALWRNDHDLATVLLVHLSGPFLAGHLKVAALCALLGVAEAGAGWLRARALLLALPSMAFAWGVPTVLAMHTPFFASSFQTLVILGCARYVVEPGPEVTSRRVAWARVAARILVVGLALATGRVYRGYAYTDTSEAEIARQAELSAAVTSATRTWVSVGATSRVFVTTCGAVSAPRIEYDLRRVGLKVECTDAHRSGDLADHRAGIAAADLVVAAEGGASGVFEWLPSAGLADQTLALCRADPTLQLAVEVPTATGRSFVLFVRPPPASR